MQRPERRRLAVDIPIELYEQAKMIANRRNITMTRLIMKLIFAAMQREKELE